MGWSVLKVLHVLAVLVWVGGMAFAHLFLRPSLAVLEPPQRLALMHAVLGHFLGAMLPTTAVLFASGLALLARNPSPPWDWLVMAAVGLVMLAVFGHIRFVLWPRMDRAVRQAEMPAAAAALARIRAEVLLNLALGLGLTALVLVF